MYDLMNGVEKFYIFYFKKNNIYLFSHLVSTVLYYNNNKL